MIQRSIHNDILSSVDNPHILLIKGGRGVGKSVLMQQIREELEHRGDPCLVLEVSTRRWAPEFANPEQFVSYIRQELKDITDHRLYIFMDNVHHLAHAEEFLAAVHDELGDQVRMVVSASNVYRRFINHDDLEGRLEHFALRPFSWRGYLQYHGVMKGSVDVRPYTDEAGLRTLYKDYGDVLRDELVTFLRWGGYPRVLECNSDDAKKTAMSGIIYTYIDEEITRILRQKQVPDYVAFVRYMMRHVGEFLNHHEASTVLGMHKQTLKKYMRISTATFLFSYLRPFYRNQRSEMSKRTKVYANDVGVASYFAGDQQFPQHYATTPTWKIKNFIHSEFSKGELGDKLYFYRTIAKAEIDFIIEAGEKLFPVEVSYTPGKQKQSVALKNFVERYAKEVETSIVITQDDLRFEKDCLYIPAILFPFMRFKE